MSEGLDRQRERWAAYQECKKRGHERSDIVFDTNPPWYVCKWCGTHFQYGPRPLYELYQPNDPATLEETT